MAAPTPNVLYLLLVPIAALSCMGAGASAARTGNVRDSCRVTRHQSLCFRSLAPFATRPATTTRGPHWWARASMSVTIAETRRVRFHLSGLKRSGRLSGGKKAGYALADCLECLDDALLQLGGALGELRRLRPGTFGLQMSNVETWASAAMTDGDTCLDGFGGIGGPQARAVCGMVRDLTYLTSNALAFVHELATSGGKNELIN